MIAQAHTLTLPLRDLENLSEFGSAVPIHIGEHHFLATAAHFISNSQQFEIIRERDKETLDSFIAKHFDRDADIGLLEIPSDKANLIENFLPETNILPTLDTENPTDALVVGYPVELQRAVSSTAAGCCAATYLFETLPLSKWPTAEFERPPDPQRDILLKYEPTVRVHLTQPSKPFPKGHGALRQTPDPGGMSGGGLWSVGAALTDVWTPRCLLTGIQVDFHRKHSVLRATLMKHWLQLVSENYPDLKAHVERIMKNRV